MAGSQSGKHRQGEEEKLAKRNKKGKNIGEKALIMISGDIQAISSKLRTGLTLHF